MLTAKAAQHQRFLKQLRLGPVDTFTAIRELNIVRPASRICELRSMGYEIRTVRLSIDDDQGRTHLGIALYVLVREPSK